MFTMALAMRNVPSSIAVPSSLRGVKPIGFPGGIGRPEHTIVGTTDARRPSERFLFLVITIILPDCIVMSEFIDRKTALTRDGNPSLSNTGWRLTDGVVRAVRRRYRIRRRPPMVVFILFFIPFYERPIVSRCLSAIVLRFVPARRRSIAQMAPECTLSVVNHTYGSTTPPRGFFQFLFRFMRRFIDCASKQPSKLAMHYIGVTPLDFDLGEMAVCSTYYNTLKMYSIIYNTKTATGVRIYTR